MEDKRMEEQQETEQSSLEVEQLMTHILADNRRLRAQCETTMQAIQDLSMQVQTLNDKLEIGRGQ